MQRFIVIAAMLLTAHVGAARGITSKDLIGTWIMGAAGGDTVYGTFCSDRSYTITHGQKPWRQGLWELLHDGTQLRLTDGSGSSINIIRRFDGRLLHVTIDNGVSGAWKKAAKRPNQAMQRTAGRSAFPFSMTSTFNQQRRAPSPAVADLVFR